MSVRTTSRSRPVLGPETSGRPRRRRVVLGVLVAVCGVAFTSSNAAAAEQWNDGVPAMSTQVKCVINLQETGAIAQAGYLADPSKPPKAGEVFYGRADFGATTDTACSSGDQLAELNIVLPPGVSLAIDAGHPITCLISDDGKTEAPSPTCPTHTVVGAFGPALPADDAGHAWTMPAGREFDVRFPLRSDRQLMGPGGGHCPQSVDEIPTSPQRDCLLVALHVTDGYSDPWLAPSEELFVDPPPAATPPVPAPTPTVRPAPTLSPRPTSTTSPKPTTTTSPKPTTTTPPKPTTAAPTPTVSQIAFTGAHLATMANKRFGLSLRCATACHGTVAITVAARTAKRLHLGRAALSLARSPFSAPGGTPATVHFKVSRRLAVKLRRLRSLPVSVTVTPAGGVPTVARLTLRR